MKSKLSGFLLALLILGSDALIFASAANAQPAFAPDGISAVTQRNRRRRSRRRRRPAQPKVYSSTAPPGMGGAQKGAEPTEAEPMEAEPPTSAAPPNVAAPAPLAVPRVLARPVGPARATPKIKPPTVQIKPPTD